MSLADLMRTLFRARAAAPIQRALPFTRCGTPAVWAATQRAANEGLSIEAAAEAALGLDGEDLYLDPPHSDALPRQPARRGSPHRVPPPSERLPALHPKNPII